MPLTTITLSGLPPERLAAASSLSNFTRTLAGSIGTSITTTMWTNRESLHHAQLTESVNPYNPNAQAMYDKLQDLGMTHQQASGWIAQQITNQGLIISANEIFWMSAGIFWFCLVWCGSLNRPSARAAAAVERINYLIKGICGSLLLWPASEIIFESQASAVTCIFAVVAIVRIGLNP